MLANGALAGLVAITAPRVRHRAISRPDRWSRRPPRVGRVEDQGLDLPEMGVLAYPEGIIAADPSAPIPAVLMQSPAREAA